MRTASHARAILLILGVTSALGCSRRSPSGEALRANLRDRLGASTCPKPPNILYTLRLVIGPQGQVFAPDVRLDPRMTNVPNAAAFVDCTAKDLLGWRVPDAKPGWIISATLPVAADEKGTVLLERSDTDARVITAIESKWVVREAGKISRGDIERALATGVDSVLGCMVREGAVPTPIDRAPLTVNFKLARSGRVVRTIVGSVLRRGEVDWRDRSRLSACVSPIVEQAPMPSHDGNDPTDVISLLDWTFAEL